MRRCPSLASARRDIVLVREGPSEGLLQASARLGFKGMTVHHLGKLMRMVCPGTPRSNFPAVEKPMVEFLVRAAFPSCTPEFLASAYAARGKTPPCDSILTFGDNMDALEHSLDEDDADEIKKSVKRVVESRGGASSRTAAISASRAPAARPAEPAIAKVRRPFEFRDEWALSEAKLFLPTAAGVSLQKDPKRFLRWSGSYPRPTPPHYVTKSWGPCSGLSQHLALAHVLKQMWAWHEEQTGQPCPFDWSAF